MEGANIPQGTAVLADKGYACGENRSYLQTHHFQDGIMHKAQRNRALTEEEKQRNKAIRVRYGAPSNAPLAVFAGGFMADDVDTGGLPRPILKTFLKASPLIYTERQG